MTPTPLAHLLRPTTFADYIGQSHIVGPGKALTQMVEQGRIPSLILWGPPGCGKTTLARLLAQSIDAIFISISAVESSTAEIRNMIQDAKNRIQALPTGPTQTILFIDEIHRFNKLQQDALLGAVEEGTITLIGATTENPGFSVIPALVSRCQTYRLYAHTDIDAIEVVKKAAHILKLTLKKDAISFLISYGSGDLRKILNALELASIGHKTLTAALLTQMLQSKTSRYDKTGDDHYDTISAFIKSMRGSQPDASLHYLARMIESGEDPLFIARRMVIFASEDVGNIQPTALVVATSCMQAIAQIGMPEGRIILAQCATYLATCKKSTASYEALGEAERDIKDLPWDPIPLHLRNPVNKVVKAEKYGDGHVRYPWKEDAKGNPMHQEYMPKNLIGKRYYRPTW